jgi:hypothetical protein
MFKKWFCGHKEIAFAEFGYDTIGGEWYDRFLGIKPYKYPCQWNVCLKCGHRKADITLASTEWSILMDPTHFLHALVVKHFTLHPEKMQPLVRESIKEYEAAVH